MRSFPSREYVRLGRCSVLMALMLLCHHAAADDAGVDFSITNNPNGNWSYGYTTVTNGPFTPLTNSFGGTFEGWFNAPGEYRMIEYNTSGLGITGPGPDGGGVLYFDAGEIAMFTPSYPTAAVLRWTAPTSGVYAVITQYGGLAPSIGVPTTTVSWLHNDIVLHRNTNPPFGPSAAVTNNDSAAAGDTVDFVVDSGTTSQNAGGSIGVYHTITPFSLLNTDVRVSMVADRDSIAPGGSIGYTITITNTGPATVPSITLNDVVPANLKLTSENFTGPGTLSVIEDGSGAWLTISDFEAGQSAQLVFRARVLRPRAPCGTGPGTAVTNVAQAIYSPYDLNPSNDTATVVTTEVGGGTPPCPNQLRFTELLADSIACPHQAQDTNLCALVTKGKFTIQAVVPLADDFPQYDLSTPVTIQVGHFQYSGRLGDDPRYFAEAKHATLVQAQVVCQGTNVRCRSVKLVKISLRWTVSTLAVTVVGQTPIYVSPILADQYQGDPSASIETSITGQIGIGSTTVPFTSINVLGGVSTKSVTTTTGQLSPSVVKLTGTGVN